MGSIAEGSLLRMGETVTISAGFASVLRTAYPLISSNIRAGAPQTGHWCGGFSPSWMYPHNTHRHFFIFGSKFGFPGIRKGNGPPQNPLPACGKF
jgi:hypothetical protein